MAKYTELVEQIIENIGGKENIATVTHCVTRLRFMLKDEKLANDEVIKNMNGVVTVMKTAGQYQVVIGNHVPDVYNELLKQANINQEEQSKNNQVKMSIKEKAIDILSGIVLPAISILAASGIIKGLLAAFVLMGLIDPDGSWYLIYNAIGDGMMYFFPFFVGFNAAKKFGVNPYIGLVVGAALCYPSIDQAELTFFGITTIAKYTGTVLPTIFIVAAIAPVERKLNKVLPNGLNTILTPMIIMLTMIPLGFLVIGPITNVLSLLIAVTINAIYNFSPVLAGIVLGFSFQFLVVMGLHMLIIIPSMMNLIAGTPDSIMPLFMAISFVQTGMVLAIFIKTKDAKLKEIAGPAALSGLFGVTEPGIYGVTLPRFKYFLITCIISAVFSGLSGLTQPMMYTISGSGIFSIPGNLDPSGIDTFSFYWMLFIRVASFVTALGFGLVLFKDEETQKGSDVEFETEKRSENILSPLTGEVKPLSSIEDVAFSEGLLGQGVAIEPTQGVVKAPFDGTVMTLFPTKHAIGLVSDTGCEVLIHVGMDTVQLNGLHFKTKIEQGARVKQGDILVEFDIEKIKEAGYSTVTPIVVTNTNDYLDVVSLKNGTINAQEDLMKVMV